MLYEVITHGAPQAVCLTRCEAGGDDGELHDLFLEQGDAEGFLEDRFEGGMGIDDGLFAVAAAQVGVHSYNFV